MSDHILGLIITVFNLQENITMMMDYIRQGFRERVNQMNWLSDLSKQRSIEKINAITSHAPYPAQIFNNDYVNGLYATVSKRLI